RSSGEEPTKVLLSPVYVVGYGDPATDSGIRAVPATAAEEGSGDETITIRSAAAASDGRTEGEPLVIIDGVRADESAMRRLSPSAIVSINVLKGAAAAAEFPDAEAEHGVVSITTRNAAP